MIVAQKTPHTFSANNYNEKKLFPIEDNRLSMFIFEKE